jgi:hypothetical protein
VLDDGNNPQKQIGAKSGEKPVNKGEFETNKAKTKKFEKM